LAFKQGVGFIFFIIIIKLRNLSQKVYVIDNTKNVVLVLSDLYTF